MRVDELINELSKCKPEAEVVVVVSPQSVVDILGVFDEDREVMLDPSSEARTPR